MAERTDTGRPQAVASSDSAALVSAADSAADSAGESVTKERYNPCASVSGHITEATLGQTAKLTILSPSTMHYRGGRSAIDQTVYPGLDQFWDKATTSPRPSSGPSSA